MIQRLIACVAAVCLLIVPSRAGDPDAKAQIEGVLREMAAACVSGDAAAYLEHVATADSEFLHEQRYFANDLAKKPAKECELTVADLEWGDGTAQGVLTMEWTMPERKPRSVSFTARFLNESGAWKYAGEVWEKHEAPGVLVLCAPGLDALADRVVKAFGEVRAHVEDGFMLTDKDLPRRTQKIKLYGTMKHLQASICLSYTDSLSGWNEPGESIKLLCGKNTSIGALRSLIAHEYGHVATFELGPDSNKMPWWILEGVADLAAEQWGGKADGLVRAWAAAGRLAAWEDITDFETVQPRWQQHVYKQGHHMLGYISDTYGREKRVEWMIAMSNGATLDEATRRVLGRSFDDLSNQWRATLPAPDESKPGAWPEKSE
ncbi:MAG: hypothetical protein JNK25_00795 [Phycisphaerae bacterium]|nr:hypothetical protein [Phycisphaerae bacterium]